MRPEGGSLAIVTRLKKLCHLQTPHEKTFKQTHSSHVTSLTLGTHISGGLQSTGCKGTRCEGTAERR